MLDNELNEYGDHHYTSYGDDYRSKWGPLFCGEDGESKTLYQYLVEKYPSYPWLKSKREWVRRMLKDQDLVEVAAIIDWMIQNQLNEFGEPMDTVYLPNGPLFNILTGHRQSLYEYLTDIHSESPWQKQEDLNERMVKALQEFQNHESHQENNHASTDHINPQQFDREGGIMILEAISEKRPQVK